MDREEKKSTLLTDYYIILKYRINKCRRNVDVSMLMMFDDVDVLMCRCFELLQLIYVTNQECSIKKIIPIVLLNTMHIYDMKS